MKLPTPVDYQEAVQIPQRAFEDEILQRGKPLRNGLGLPNAISGGFALTFKIEVGSECFAVRCFHKEGNHLQERYARIAEFVQAHERLGFLVDVDYIPTGIRVRNSTLPIVRMPWVEGRRLDSWIDNHLNDPDALGAVRRHIREAVTALRRVGVAHGDLQHGNILVRPDHNVRFVDYDGMFLPALRPLGPSEQGHRNFQHPDRADHYDASIDLFATFVIDLSLEALQHDPVLWDEFHTGENLLFSGSDFARPEQSGVFARLGEIAPLAARLRRLREACTAEFAAVPDILRGVGIAGPQRRSGRARTRTYDLPRPVPAAERDTLLACQGDEVTTFGRIVDARLQPTAYGKMAFVNLGDWRRGDFTIIAFDQVCKELCQEYGADLAGLKGRWVSITGMVTAYRGKRSYWTPQIELRRLRSLRMLDMRQVEEFEAAANGAFVDETDQIHEPPEARDLGGSDKPTTTSAPASVPSGAPQQGSGALPGKPAASGSGADDLQQRLGRLYSSPGFAAQVSPHEELNSTGSATRSPCGGADRPPPELPTPPQPWPVRPPVQPGPVPPQYRVYRLPPSQISPPQPSAPPPPPPPPPPPVPPPPPNWQSGWSVPYRNPWPPAEQAPNRIRQLLKRWFGL